MVYTLGCNLIKIRIFSPSMRENRLELSETLDNLFERLFLFDSDLMVCSQWKLFLKGPYNMYGIIHVLGPNKALNIFESKIRRKLKIHMFVGDRTLYDRRKIGMGFSSSSSLSVRNFALLTKS